MMRRVKRAIRVFLALWPRNLIANRLVKPLALGQLALQTGIEVHEFSFLAEEFERWESRFQDGALDRSNHLRPKKWLEFFVSHSLLGVLPNDVFMDVGGGQETYLDRLKAKTLILQDLHIPPSLRQWLGQSVQFIEGDAGRIDLADGSVDKIACHHSFEHFQADSDSRFIDEVQRLLRVNGTCCIVPIFISDHYVELTDRFNWRQKFDPDSRRVIDPTATLPGGQECGNYARVYNPESFRRRVVDRIDRSRFSAVLWAVSMDGTPMPDMKAPAHRKTARINFPYRALVIRRFR